MVERCIAPLSAFLDFGQYIAEDEALSTEDLLLMLYWPAFKAGSSSQSVASRQRTFN
jgi:hypothetical protein